MMQRRLNPFTIVPDGLAALAGVENYLKTSDWITGSSRW